MNKVTQQVIDELTRQDDGIKLTIYMPTQRISTPPTIQEDKIRYKNLIRKGHDQWCEKGDEQQAADIFAKLEAKLTDESFWEGTTEGLAVFVDENSLQWYHLPMECEERVCVTEKFEVTPLHIVMNYDQPYYVLALALHGARLYKGDAYELSPLSIDFPTSPEDALNIDEMFNNSNTQRGYEGPASSGYAISTHGSGDSNRAGEAERLQYFRIIDDIILKAKEVDVHSPILIAAAEDEISDYKNVSKLPNLVKGSVHGNHLATELHQLHALTWKVIHDEIVMDRQNRLIERFNEQKGIHKASSDLADIKEATGLGKVDTLFICAVDQTNDSVRESADMQAPLIRFDEKYDTNDIPSIVKAVMAQGGKIVGLEAGKFNVPSMVGAVYRF